VDHFTTCVINIGLVANYKVHSTVAKQLVFIQVFIYFHWHHGEHTKPHACVSSLIAHKILILKMPICIEQLEIDYSTSF